MDEFDDDVALDAGQWDRRFARVLAKAVGESAVAIIDANGADGGVTYANLETFTWDEQQGWINGISHGGCGPGWSSGMAYVGGEAAVGEKVVVEFRAERHEVEVQPTGWWLFAVASDGSDATLPRRVR